ncbi:MAG: hypothetical protein ABI837_11630 [Acidobacteriota bacterium]
MTGKDNNLQVNLKTPVPSLIVYWPVVALDDGQIVFLMTSADTPGHRRMPWRRAILPGLREQHRHEIVTGAPVDVMLRL